jgi:hypothetical protein
MIQHPHRIPNEILLFIRIGFPSHPRSAEKRRSNNNKERKKLDVNVHMIYIYKKRLERMIKNLFHMIWSRSHICLNQKHSTRHRYTSNLKIDKHNTKNHHHHHMKKAPKATEYIFFCC